MIIKEHFEDYKFYRGAGRKREVQE